MKKNPMAIMVYTKLSIIPSNQLLLPSHAIKFSIMAPRKIAFNSNNVNTNEFCGRIWNTLYYNFTINIKGKNESFTSKAL